MLAVLLSQLSLASNRPRQALACDAVDVRMNHYIVGRASTMPAIQSTGAGPCVLLILYDRQTKVGMMAHISQSVDVAAALTQIYADLGAQGAPTNRLEAQIFGGWAGFSERVVEQIETGLRYRQIPIREKEVNSNIGFNLRQYMNNSAIMGSTRCRNCVDPSMASIKFNLETGVAYDILLHACPADSVANSAASQRPLPLKSASPKP